MARVYRGSFCFDPFDLHNLGGSGCTTRHKCHACQGDCDRDTDCQAGLRCLQRNGLQSIHGCRTGGASDVKGYECVAVLHVSARTRAYVCAFVGLCVSAFVCDDIGWSRCSFCYDPTGLHNFGGTGCTPNTPCSACQGDCDKDADCFKGLKCFQRNGFTQVHGCSKATGAMNVKNYVRVPACARHTRVWCAMESCELIT